MNYRWTHRSVEDEEAVARLRQALNDLPEALARPPVVRGIETFDQARDFFRCSREDLHDPFRMAGMEQAAGRLAEAVEGGERVLVYGDYDVDGTCSTALMTHFLRAQGVEASYFIPDRYEHGYGLCNEGIAHAADRGASLIVALDCGITAHEEADYVRDRGPDHIICDHHKPKATLPDALAVLDPKRPDCGYPFKELCGCGVGFKLVQATLARLGRDPEDAFAYLDLVGLATACDIVPLHGENRVLMQEGLDALRTRARLGLRALADVAGVDLVRLSSTGTIVFTLGPRINAAGRMGHARDAVDLLLATDAGAAAERARKLDTLNNERRGVERAVLEGAVALAERQITARTPHALVLHRPDWHLGVLGIVASRLVERFYKPTILLAGEETAKGSARSISGVNVHDALSACEEHLIQFGGHDYAAGMTLRAEDVPAFREAFDAAVGMAITPELLTPAIKVDAPLDLTEIGRLGDRFWAVLKQFEPFGPANARPVFHAGSLAIAGRPRTVGRGGDHLKFRVRPFNGANGTAMDVIGFRMGERLPVLQRAQREGRPLELLFSIKENDYRGRVTLQLEARDLRLAQ